jgi:hypothetical protein
MKGGPTNHDCIREVFQSRRGEQFSTAEIARMMLEKRPAFNPGSVLPNDHANGNKSPCWCAGKAERIFDKIQRGIYRVR